MVHHRGHRSGARDRPPHAARAKLTSDRPAASRVYDDLAEEYDARWEEYVRRSTEATLARAELPSDGVLLDVGCGTGVLLERVAVLRPELRLVGLDLSARMLARASTRVPARVHLVQASAERLPLPDGSIDLVVSASSLHFWPEPEGAMREIARVLRPGGSAVITDWCRDHLLTLLRDLRLRIMDPAHVRALSSDELEAHCREVGLEVERIDRYRVPGRWGLMTGVARKVASGGRAPSQP